MPSPSGKTYKTATPVNYSKKKKSSSKKKKKKKKTQGSKTKKPTKGKVY